MKKIGVSLNLSSTSGLRDPLPYLYFAENDCSPMTLFIPGLIYCQNKSGIVLSTETQAGIGFVNIGIIGKNIGTVTDIKGNYSLKLDKIYDNDSIRFSVIGFESGTYLVRDFRNDSTNTIYLKPVTYQLKEVKVNYRRHREIQIGEKVTSGNLVSGFFSNDLGAEMGIKVYIKRPIKLSDINLNVAVCTFDSVSYSLNIYESIHDKDYRKILHQPVYISFSKDKISKVITIDLRKHLIEINGNVMITLELYKDPGKGSLLFYTKNTEDFIWHKKTSEGTWTTSHGSIGFYSHAQLIKQ